MSLRSTFRPRFGPFTVNTGQRGVTSVSMRLGPFTFRLWDPKGRSGVSSVDLPGPISFRPGLRGAPLPRTARTRTVRPEHAAVPGPAANPAPWGMNPKYRT